jgi:hypothetical protein
LVQPKHFAKQQEAQMVRPKTAACRDVNEPRRNKRIKFRVATYGMMPGFFGKMLEASCEISINFLGLVMGQAILAL